MGFTLGLVKELDAVGDWGLLTTDARLTITGWNRWLERHAGMAAGAVIGRKLYEVFPALLTRKLDRYYQQALGGQIAILSQRFHKYVLPMSVGAGGTGFVQMQQTTRIVPLLNGEEVSGTVTVIEDVTERIAYETELQERVEALREADRRKDEFLATLAHELRNPLAPIRNSLAIMSLTSDPAIANRARDLIDRQVVHMVRLVDDLMEVSRITRGKVDLQKRRLDLRVAVESAIETSRPHIEAANHAFKITLPPEPLYIEGDLTRMAQIVANLLNNAAKYTPANGAIAITAERDGRQATVRVEDNGLGIPPEMLTRVFDLFTQVDRHLERAQGGLGIGLSLVRKLLDLHGGTIEAHSDGVGQGSAFTIRLPLADDPLMPPAESVKAVSPTLPITPRSILVVDDNLDSATSLATVLELLGHNVRTVHDGLAAISAATEFRPHVILMDIGMPGLNGYDACLRIRSEPWGADMVLVALTGWGQDDDRRRALEVGFDMHMVKPVDLLALGEFLENHPHR
ncbi:hybrid sensor histidine kinase/response regulator [Limnoglobus roseus]|uniref:histidine kinase n=1 Tax=Limnoglobus roseus TaxID=2598579 RepID=A0A5C1ATQ8_9BACT|nr:ATP-binding protein [Limnoglobus roseus]QEL20604.1 PAS domain S-box protein [Limnoglobus roseus]